VEWTACGVDGLRGKEFGPAVTVEPDVPSLAMHNRVVILAQQTHIADFRLAPLDPGNDVVGVTVAGWALARGKGASLIPVDECVAQGAGGQVPMPLS
jgi:hypothetical protein